MQILLEGKCKSIVSFLLQQNVSLADPLRQILIGRVSQSFHFIRFSMVFQPRFYKRSYFGVLISLA